VNLRETFVYRKKALFLLVFMISALNLYGFVR